MSIGTLITQGTGTDTERTWGPSGNVAAISHGATKAKAPPWRLGRECGPAAPGFQSPGDRSYERYVLSVPATAGGCLLYSSQRWAQRLAPPLPMEGRTAPASSFLVDTWGEACLPSLTPGVQRVAQWETRSHIGHVMVSISS